MPDRSANPSATPLPQRYLCAGGLMVLTAPCEVTTILGPCVAVTLWNRAAGVAAICHAMLPDSGGEEHGGRDDRCDWKYVSTALPEMLARFRRGGGMRGIYQVKVFGGANLIEGASAPGTCRIGAGARNVERALELLQAEGLVPAARDTGGTRGRKLIFNTLTGGVRVKALTGPQLLAA